MINRSNIRFYLVASLFLLFNPTSTTAQTVSLQGQIFEYATYYISSFNMSTGASTVQLFRYRLESDSYPVWVKIWFRASMLSPSLEINTPITIVELETNPFQLQADLMVDNRYISSAASTLYDMGSPPNPVIISGNLIEVINPSQFEELLIEVVQRSKLPDGEYTFNIKVYSGSNPNNLTLTDQDFRSIIVQTPTSLNLESPGGTLADTSQNEIYTTFPIFNWYSQLCAGCENSIRVAEFIPGIHSSVEEAIEDDTALPFNTVEPWESVGSFTSYQYPLSGARPLEFGNIYVWQIRQEWSTTAGDNEMLSPIWAFKIVDIGGGPSAPAALPAILQVLQQTLGDDQFNALFGPESELLGFTPTGVFNINGVTVDESSVSYILNQIMNQNLTVSSIQVED